MRHVLAVALVYVLAVACGFVLFGGLPLLLDGPAKALPGYRAKGPVQALRVQPPPAGDAAAQRAHFDGAVAFAKQNGYNTLIFEAKNDLSAWWRDDTFPPAFAGTSAAADPLAQLFAAADGQNLQVWLEVDPYAGADALPDSQAKAVAHLKGAGTAPVDGFSAADEDYRALLVESLAALPLHYPVGGFVFKGLEKNAAASGDGARYSLAVQAMLVDLHTALAEKGRLVPLGLAYAEENGALNAGYAAKLCGDGLITYLLPQMASGNQNYTARLARLGTKGVLASPQAGDATGLSLFLAARSPGYTGTVLGTWPDAAAAQTALGLYKSVSTPVDAPLPQGFDLPQLLGVSYPAQNAKLTDERVFVMGSSDPNQPLYLDGNELLGRQAGGLFGTLVELQLGENHFTFSQGDRAITLDVTREEPQQGAAATYPADGTYEAKDGQAVVVTAQIASALTDPTNPGTINETFFQGASFVIDESLEIKYDGATTWAYKLKSGDYVLGNLCRLVPGDGASSFTGLTAAPDEGGEWIDFAGTGTPGAYVEYKDEGVLTLTFYDTALAIPEGFTSQHVTGAAVAQNEDGSTTLSLSVTDIWGYSLEYQNGVMRLYLKNAPHRGADPLRPLEGVSVLLDPGHGDTDAGTPGVLWDVGPHEKALNLALAQAVSYRLQQLGATVSMTRTDDSFPTLQERLAMQTQQKPDSFIAIHHNSGVLTQDLNDAKGVEGYYYHPYSIPASRQLAQNLTLDVSALTGREHRKDAEWSYFYVTRTMVCPSVLFEYGYAINPAELADVASTEGIYGAAFATAQAVVDTVPQ